MDIPKVNLQERAQRQAERIGFRPRAVEEPPPVDEIAPPPVEETPSWDVQSVNVIDKVSTNPEQTSISRLVTLVSITYVDPETGETATLPVSPVVPPEA